MLNWPSGKFVIEPRPIQLEESKTAKQKPQQKYIIVIVNNSMVVQKLLQRAFDSMGYEVYAVETAAKAMNMVKSMQPHLIISDIKLPDSGGVEFVQSVRGITEAPVVLLTESANRAQFEGQAKNHGNVHFTNSHEVGEVVKVVEGALQ
jgi:CheY-like chemotaxis protein